MLNNVELFWLKRFQDYDLDRLSGHLRKQANDQKVSESFHLDIDPEILQKFRKVTGDSPLGCYSFFLTAFNLINFKYTGLNDVVVATTGIEKNADEVLFLRSKFQPSDTLKSVLQMDLQGIKDTFSGKGMPFQQLKNFLEVNLKIDLNAFLTVGIYSHALHFPSDTLQQCNILLEIDDQSADPKIVFHYSDELDKDFVQRFAHRYLFILRHLLDNLDATVQALPWFDQDEIDEVLHEFNKPIANKDFQDFVSLIDQKARDTPQKVVVEFGEVKLTYEELIQHANQVAGVFNQVSSSVNEVPIIALMIPRSHEMLIFMVAALKSQHAFLLLETDYQSERLSYVINDSQPDLLITENLENNPVFEVKNLSIMTSREVFEKSQMQPEDLPSFESSPDQIAYVVYTSGTSGDPKGVKISRRGMMNHFFAQIETMQLTDQDRIAQTSPAGFVIATWQFLCGPIAGSTVIIIDNETVKNPHQLMMVLSQRQVNILQVVPSHLEMILTIEEAPENDGLNALKYLFLTGEELRYALVSRWFKKYPSVKMINGYGMSEVSDDTTHHILSEVPATGVVPLGKIISNNRIYVLDENGDICPSGVLGEIWVSGLGVSKGYLGLEDMTREKFTKDRFIDRDDIFMYKTGDFGLWDSHGQLHYRGRKDRQVKIRGMRVELRDIEQQLMKSANVTDVRVVYDASEESLVAYLIPAVGEELERAKILESLLQKLPGHMIPAFLVFLPEFPVNANGKVDVSKFPKPGHQDLVEGRVIVSPANDVEERLLSLWTQILGISSISTTDSFFSIGGDSFKVVNLYDLLNEAFPDVLEIHHLFNLVSIQKQAEFILSHSEEESDDSNTSIKVSDF